MVEIKRILVANCGEIALRVIRTIKEMGKEVVAVYSIVDKEVFYLKFFAVLVYIGDMIFSFMVGTFYAVPLLDSVPFVKVGDRVKKG